MSIHPSLRGVDTLTGDRSVFKRIERLQQLMKEGKLTEADSAYGLPMVRTSFKLKKKKVEATDAEADEAAEATPAE